MRNDADIEAADLIVEGSKLLAAFVAAGIRPPAELMNRCQNVCRQLLQKSRALGASATVRALAFSLGNAIDFEADRKSEEREGGALDDARGA